MIINQCIFPVNTIYLLTATIVYVVSGMVLNMKYIFESIPLELRILLISSNSLFILLHFSLCLKGHICFTTLLPLGFGTQTQVFSLLKEYISSSIAQFHFLAFLLFIASPQLSGLFFCPCKALNSA
ncbi:hypothetical protein CsatB_004131 [Cannabis sativa]